ncbi:iron complex transport system substrate-binding protein [Streptoalloteichus tenebrarius]|uniref:Iron complex transport system substrate-binding protein n=1 Tax=Streptoalloteichus tenebrarius (strain ATCC 17920 / DSM 40477 / JCM 4838 / CBS 697.72 / NBRC 16177 / NCIMB 11028 / NRRL B-12390 / A12253. 1 / ISP 5477) TaxID=1933 RepID=A0ABT1HWS4_STRSD|nr:ABC transporter substrate-binding protein [Streptoalloteichus tenebrarius]MCP2259977.1 iron complex transport system substrate-binding protein [Streptoalloteichus tenebrarius]BFF03913.1 siderophore-binding protein DesE [Streptoalloteichus tenebrarius]
MSQSRAPQLSRRGLLAAFGAIGLGAVVAACGSGGGGGNGGGSTSSGQAGGWSFTDDRQQRVTSERRPERVVAFVGSAAALWDFGLRDQIVGVFGPARNKDGTPGPQAGDLDVNKVTIVGGDWGEFDIEKYLKLRPELLVTNMFQPPALWYVPDDSKDKILGIAPSVGITTAKVRLVDVVGRYAALAKSLGADLEAKPVVDAKARFEKASEALRKAAKEKGGLRVMAASGSPELLYVSDPNVYPDLSYFRELGVDIVVPDKVDGGFFEHLSWENARKYPADIILLDNRSAALQPKDLASRPAWAELPAVRANQVVPWQSEPRFSYAGLAPIVESLAKAVQDARKVS